MARPPKSRYSTLKADLSILPLFSGKLASIRGGGAPPPGGGPPAGGWGSAGGSAPPLKSNSLHLTYVEDNVEFTNLNFREFDDGKRVATWGRKRRRNPDRVAARGTSENVEKNREAVLRRAKNNVLYKSMHNHLDYLITLTTRENIQDRDRFGKMVSEFERRVKIRLPDWDAICVLERQQRGAYHAHLAVRGWQKLHLLRSIWKVICGPGGGAINVRPPPANADGKRLRWTTERLARYLCKYLTKAIGEEHILDKKTYWHTRGIDDPPITTVPVAVGSEAYWANYLVSFLPGYRKRNWDDYNGAIGKVINF